MSETFPSQLQLEEQQEWVDNFLAVLESYRIYKPDQKRIKQFLDTPSSFELCDHYAHNLVMDIFGRFHQGITQKEERFNADFFRMLYKLNMMIGERFKLMFHEHFIEEWQRFPIDYCPYFEIVIPEFSKRLDDACDAIVLNLERVEPQIREEFRWLLLVCPVNVLRHLFTRVISNPAVIDYTIDMCTQIPSLFYDRNLKIWHNEFETPKDEPLLAVAIRRFIYDRRTISTEDDQWDTIRRLFLAFCREDKDNKPLLSRWILLEIVFDEIYSGTRLPTTSVEMLTEVAATILESRFPVTHVFATSKTTKPAKGVYMTPTIIIMLLELVKEYHKNKKSISIVISCKRILSAIGTRMKEQNGEFDQQTKDFLLQHLSQFPWFARFAISTWFGLVDDNKRRIPLAIFQAIYPDSGSKSDEKFELIHVEGEVDILPADLPFAYFDNIIELGLFDPICARELLGIKTEFQFNLDDLPALMHNGFKKSYDVKLGLHHFESSSTLSMNILAVFDPSKAHHEQKLIVSILHSLPMPSVKEEFPKCTQDIKKSVSIPSLDTLIESEGKEWPLFGEQRVIPVNTASEEKREIPKQPVEKWGQHNMATDWKFGNPRPIQDDDALSFSSTSTNPRRRRNYYPRTIRPPSTNSSISIAVDPSTSWKKNKKKNGVKVDPTPLKTAFGATVNEITSSIAQMKMKKERSSKFEAIIASLKDDGTPGRVFAGCAKRGGRGQH